MNAWNDVAAGRSDLIQRESRCIVREQVLSLHAMRGPDQLPVLVYTYVDLTYMHSLARILLGTSGWFI